MKNRKTLCALLLTGTMIMGLGTNVFAAEEPTTPPVPTISVDGTASITKNLELAEGIAIPENTKFSFTVTKVTTDAPNATITDISYTETDKTTTNFSGGKYTISKTASITFGTFPHAGVYEYTVKEATPETPDTNMSYSADEYKLRVYVKNNIDNGLTVDSITAEKSNLKQEQVLFTNTYRKTSSLTIKKETKGDYADKTKDFNFTINFTKSPTDTTSTVFTGKIGTESVTCTPGTSQTFSLHDGEELKFDSNLPAGTRYVVTETAATDGYTPSIKLKENGTQKDLTTFQDADAATATGANNTNALVGEGENSVTFTNTYNDVALTGVILNNLPFLILIGIGACALAVLAFSKKRRSANR